jgi:hypothetical protein
MDYMEQEGKTPEQISKELWQAQVNFKRVLAKRKKCSVVLKLTPKQAELIEILIDIAKGDSGNGCEYAKERQRQVDALFKRRINGTLFHT